MFTDLCCSIIIIIIALLIISARETSESPFAGIILSRFWRCSLSLSHAFVVSFLFDVWLLLTIAHLHTYYLLSPIDVRVAVAPAIRLFRLDRLRGGIGKEKRVRVRARKKRIKHVREGKPLNALTKCGPSARSAYCTTAAMLPAGLTLSTIRTSGPSATNLFLFLPSLSLSLSLSFSLALSSP